MKHRKIAEPVRGKIFQEVVEKKSNVSGSGIEWRIHTHTHRKEGSRREAGILGTGKRSLVGPKPHCPQAQKTENRRGLAKCCCNH